MKNCDLHMHTNYSDGKFSTAEVLQITEANNFSVISITDHNCVLAYDDMQDKNIRRIFSGKIWISIVLKAIKVWIC